MSAMSQIKEIIYEILVTNGKCTLEDIKNVAVERGIEISNESTLVRSTMYQLTKKDKRIQRTGRGIYRLDENKEVDESNDLTKVDCETIEYLKETEKRLTVIIDYLKNFNWFQSTDADVSRARKLGISLKKFNETLDKKIKELSL